MFRKKIFDYCILLAILVISMWQIVFRQASMKWDIVDLTLPWNHYISECINERILPLWNPFLNGGFSQMGVNDTWYPIHWFISGIWGFDLITIQFDYLLHLFIAGIGFYQLGKHYQWNRYNNVLTASAYMLSGLMIGNAQHLGWVIGAAWLPWVFLFYKKLEKTPSYKTGLQLAFVAALMFSGGYLGIFVPTAYLILFLFIYRIFYCLKNQQLNQAKKLFLISTFSLFVFVLLNAVVLMGLFHTAPYINRGDGLSLEDSMIGTLPWQAISTFIFPYLSTSDVNMWGTDWTLVNCYFGLFPFLFLIFIFFQNLSADRTEKDFKTTGIKMSLIGLLFLTIAMASIFPFRQWMYHGLPLMDLFRFSSLFRLFAIFFFLIGSGFAIEQFFQNKKIKKRSLAFSTIGVSVLVISLLGIYFTSENPANDLLKLKTQALIHLALITLLFLSFYFLKEKYHYPTLLVLSCLDLLVVTQLQMYATIVHDHQPNPINELIHQQPEGFPIPNLEKPFVHLQPNQSAFSPLHINLAHFHKTPSHGGSSPLSFHWTHRAIENGTYEKTIQNPLLFLCKNLSIDKAEINPTGIIVNETIDTFSFEKIKIEDWSPNDCTIQLNQSQNKYLVFLQNYHPDWKVYLDGKESEVIRINETFMATAITPTTNQVEFSFHPKKIIYAFYLSFVSWILVSLLLCILFFQKNKINNA